MHKLCGSRLGCESRPQPRLGISNLEKWSARRMPDAFIGEFWANVFAPEQK